MNGVPLARDHSLGTTKPIEEKIVHLRLTYPPRVYQDRLVHGPLPHGISIFAHCVYNVLVCNGIKSPPTSCRKRSMPSMRRRKQVPGRHVQVNVSSCI